MRYVIYETATGEIVGDGNDPTVSAGRSAKASDVGAVGTHYVDPTTLDVVEYSPAGKAAYSQHHGSGFSWDPASESWVDNRTITAVRADLVVKLRDKRDALLFGGLTWDGSVFDSDAEVSQPRLLGAFTTTIAGGWPAGGVAWRLKDNSWRVLSAADVQSLWAAFQTRMLSLFGAFAAHEAAVNAETDISVLRNYDTEAGWP